ncbi:pimeloyl-ACP methyl ester carboxylesterase [Arthrobacter pascens]|jgi:pimeloyl-ACP methyl ester carboxylesterase|uniref:alpha/beta fold hydrolase n=1 Tax=Arthrobacter pascens TaxID=1677 RepID=UPI00277DCF2A|nr:alpha/beta hydrolase [Arthrobacter pascens]MDQ0635240.1 pimeloyl-ACP methyl ester carboxylesterase [Arthrobacter pascens]
MDSVEVAGLRIAYQRAGAGPPLVLLHGAYEDSRIWRRQLDGLSDEFTVIAWDAPGCGQSDDPPPELTGRDFGDALAGFLRATVAGKPHVLGFSWGSCVALELYKGHPEAAASLVLASAYAGWAGSLPPEEVERRIAQITAELEQPAEAFIQDWLPTLLTERADPALLEEAAAIIADFHPAGMRAMLNAMGRSDYRDVLPAITVPTLLLYGAEDVRSPVDVANEMHRNIRDSELAVIPDVGHLAQCEAPEAFNAEVRRFLHALPA